MYYNNAIIIGFMTDTTILNELSIESKLAFDWILSNFDEILFVFITFLMTSIMARSLGSRVEQSLYKMSRRQYIDITALRMFKHLIVAIVYFFGAVIIIFSIPALRSLSFDLFAGAGVIGIIVGLAAQNTLSNIIAGISLSIFQPFRVGDRLNILNEYGKVVDLNLRHTVIVTWDNRRLIIPNSKISSEAIINWTIYDPAVIWTIDIGVSYDTNIKKAKELMIEEANKHPNVMPHEVIMYSEQTEYLKRESHSDASTRSNVRLIDEDFRERGGVKVRVTDLKDSSINLSLQVWFSDRSIAYSSSCDIRENIVTRFSEEGIEIPYPYRTIVYKK